MAYTLIGTSKKNVANPIQYDYYKKDDGSVVKVYSGKNPYNTDTLPIISGELDLINIPDNLATVEIMKPGTESQGNISTPQLEEATGRKGYPSTSSQTVIKRDTVQLKSDGSNNSKTTPPPEPPTEGYKITANEQKLSFPELAGLPQEYINAYAQLAAGRKGDYKTKIPKSRNAMDAFVNSLLAGAGSEAINQIEKARSSDEGKSDFMNKIIPALEKVTGQKFTGISEADKKKITDAYKQKEDELNTLVNKKDKTEEDFRKSIILKNELEALRQEAKKGGDSFDIKRPDIWTLQNVARAYANMPQQKAMQEWKATLDAMKEDRKQALRLEGAKNLAKFKAMLKQEFGDDSDNLASQIAQALNITLAQPETKK